MKKIILLFISVLLIFNNTNHSLASNVIPIYVNGNIITPDVNPYIENRRTFVPIRFIGEALNASSIDWNGSLKTATLTFNNTVIKLPIGSQYVTVNEKKHKIDARITLKSGRTFVPVRFISEIIGYDVKWINRSVYISNNGYTPTKKYTSEDLYWLSRIVEAEAVGEPYAGKLAVANVIINRKKSSEFPNSIKTVIFDNKYGIQFSPISNGTIYNTPTQESINAALEALNGTNNIGNSLYFLNPVKSTNFWIINNRSFYTRINNHYFYA
ncbi:MAG: stalk domain-containing protein [Vallitalea sp.]|jgi:N-acetylmuramoyl-L-alanine amidase|nr:stalk domain-containing protein [Vallitalea sp.]